MPRPKQAQTELVLINLRLRKRDVAEAKERAAALGVPYQHIIRGWVAQGAEGHFGRRVG